VQIAILGVGRVGSTLGRLWHADGHDVTFSARDAARPQALAAELGARAHAASADMRRRFKFLGDTGVWRLLTSASRDIGGAGPV